MYNKFLKFLYKIRLSVRLYLIKVFQIFPYAVLGSLTFVVKLLEHRYSIVFLILYFIMIL